MQLAQIHTTVKMDNIVFLPLFYENSYSISSEFFLLSFEFDFQRKIAKRVNLNPLIKLG